MKTHWILIGFILLSPAAVFGQLKPDSLRCESQRMSEKPTFVESQHPRLAWNLEPQNKNERGIYQSAYQILVASDEKFESILWDSGKVVSEQSVSIEYAGKQLTSRLECFWKVRVWDNKGNTSDWSKTARWEMGLLEQSDWKATWINDGRLNPTTEADFYKDDPAPVFRKTFQVKKPVKKARLYATGLGFYRVNLNGDFLHDTAINPGWTKYDKRVLYDTYIVNENLVTDNIIEINLGNGWYNPIPLRFWGFLNLREHLTIGRPRTIAQLEIEYDDGSTEMIVTDESWKTTTTKMLRNNVYLGEIHDLRMKFDENGWKNASVALEPIGPLHLQTHARTTGTKLKENNHPISITEPTPGVYILDMGENFSRGLRYKLNGKTGDKIKLRFGELIYPDGTLNVMTSVAGQVKYAKENVDGEPPKLAYQSDTLILRDGLNEGFCPEFTWHAFRYVEITGLQNKPELSDFEGIRYSPDFDFVGTFVCSDDNFNRIQKMCVNTFLSNLFSVQSDCPARERFGYGGDIVTSCDAFLFNFDMESFYRKAAWDFVDSARPLGGITSIAPHVGIYTESLGDETGSIGWQIGFPMLIEKLYQYYGDLQTMRDMYPVVKRQLEFARSIAKDGFIDFCISDHESLDPHPVESMSAAHYHYLIQMTARFAEILGYEEDAEEYRQFADRIENLIVTTFYDPETGIFDTGTQAAQACALYFCLLPKDEVGNIIKAEKAKVLAVLESEMRKNNGHIAAGIFGARYLLQTLSRETAPKLAYQMVAAPGFPGWTHMLELGATTLWEHWEFSDDTYSHCHPMFGSVSAWFYEDVTGILPENDAVGFNRFIIAPKITDDLTWADAKYDSVHGIVRSRWDRDDEGIYSLGVTVPYNTSATVYISAKDFDAVQENGSSLMKYDEIKRLKQENGQVVLQVRGGTYSFTWK